jgi:bifunctional DNase/RNase
MFFVSHDIRWKQQFQISIERLRSLRKVARGADVLNQLEKEGNAEWKINGREETAGLVFWRTTVKSVCMKKDVLPVAIRGILPANSGCAIFVGNDEKVFVIQVEHNMGAVIGMFLRETKKERPLTHDLMNDVLKGFSITVERVVITELKNSTYFARLILQQQNELGRKLVEIDARPSDCLALAAAQKRPIFCSSALFEQVEDMSSVLEKINENSDEENEGESEK